MSIESSTIQLKAIIRLGQTYEETITTFTVSPDITIGELMEYISVQVKTRYNYDITSMFYMFNEFQTDMNEEARLGGILLPNSCLLSYSMIEPGSTLFIETQASVHQAGEQLEQKEDLESLPNPPINPYQDLINQPIVDIDINDVSRILDVYSLLDMFSRVAGISQPRQPVNPMLRFNDLLQLLQVSPISGNLQQYGNLADVLVGLDRNDLDKLKCGMYKDLIQSNKHKLDMCSICFEQFNDDEECRELKCNHMFHQKCVDIWLAEHVTCPVCREETGRGVPKL